MKGRLPWILCRKRRVVQPMLKGKVMDVSIGPGPETIELVRAINQETQARNWRRYLEVFEESFPEATLVHFLEPQDQQKKHSTGDEVEGSRQARQEIHP